MRVLPAGYFNNNDWGTSFSGGFVASGGLNTAGSVNPAMPNLLFGSTCISVKDSWFRDLKRGTVCQHDKLNHLQQPHEVDIGGLYRRLFGSPSVGDPTTLLLTKRKFGTTRMRFNTRMRAAGDVNFCTEMPR